MKKKQPKSYELLEIRPGRFAKTIDGEIVGMASAQEIECYEYYKLIPPKLRKGHRDQIAKRARSRVRLFGELEALETDTKQRVLSRVLHYETQLAIIDIWLRRAKGYLFTPTLVFFFALSWVGSPIMTARWLDQEYSLLGWLGFIVILQILIMSLLLLIMGWPSLITTKYSSNLLSAFSFVWLVSMIVVYITALYQIATGAWAASSGFVRHLIASGLLGGMVYLVPSMIIVIPVTLIIESLGRRRKALCCEAVVVDGLLNLLSNIERKPEQWTEPAFKRAFMAGLEKVAGIVEHELPHQLGSNDEVTDVWLKKRFGEIAAGLRSLKKWVLTPKSDTLCHLTHHLADSLVYATTGEWDSFERVKPEQLSPLEKGQSRLRAVLGTVFTAITPMIVLLAVQQTPLGIAGEAAEYLKAGVLVWAVLCLLSLFDPLYKERITSLKDIASTLVSLGGKSDGQP